MFHDSLQLLQQQLVSRKWYYPYTKEVFIGMGEGRFSGFGRNHSAFGRIVSFFGKETGASA